MEVNVRNGNKIVEIWLTGEEQQDARFRERLKPLCQGYSEQGYLTAVYESGGQDLWDSASALLCYNRKRCAQLEAERERQSGMAMGRNPV